MFNDVVWLIYIKWIVGGGFKVGLKFGEDWEESGVENGFLFVLFLCLIVVCLEMKLVEVGFYLGLDVLINVLNFFGKD